MQDGMYHLEDPWAHIPLEFPSGLAQTPGLFTENCFVVAEGTLTPRQTLKLQAIGMPASEARSVTEWVVLCRPCSTGSTLTLASLVYSKSFKLVDFFGAPPSIHTHSDLLRMESALEDVFFVILSDVWLDQPKVLLKLRGLFEGFSNPGSIRPFAFILIGNFGSAPYLLNGRRSAGYRGETFCRFFTTNL